MKLISTYLDEIINFTIPVSGSELSVEERAEIIGMILNHWVKHNSPKKPFPGLELLLLDWTWLDSEKRTLVSRIIYLLRKFKATMTPAFYGKMGNRIREGIPAASQYYLDFTREFNWVSGQFGDARSCFMNGGSRSGILKDMTKDGNFYAMRFFQKKPVVNDDNMVALINTTPIYRVGDTKYYGKARTWIYRKNITVRHGRKLLQEPVYFMFNSYGKESLREMAAIFAAYVGVSYQSVKLKNIGKTCGGLYINAGSMIIGSKSVINNIKEYDFNIKTSYDKGSGRREILRQERGALRMRRLHEKVYGSKLFGKKYWHKTKSSKKALSSARKKRTRNDIKINTYYLLQDIMYDWFCITSWNRGNAFRNLVVPSKMRGSWKLLHHRYNGGFWQILIKLLQIKMHGGFNDTTPKSKNSGKPKDECSQPTLRPNEADMPGYYEAVELLIGPN